MKNLIALALAALALASCAGGQSSTVSSTPDAESSSSASSESSSSLSSSSSETTPDTPDSTTSQTQVEAMEDVVITPDDIPATSQSSYLVDEEIEVDGITFYINNLQQGHGEYEGTIQMKNSGVVINNKTALGHNSVVITLMDKRSEYNPYIATYDVYGLDSPELDVKGYQGALATLEEAGKVTYTYTFDRVYPYFAIVNAESDNPRAGYAYSIEFTNK